MSNAVKNEQTKFIRAAFPKFLEAGATGKTDDDPYPLDTEQYKRWNDGYESASDAAWHEFMYDDGT